MTAEEAFAEAMAELDEIRGIRLTHEGEELTGYTLVKAPLRIEPDAQLRILPAEEPAKEASTFGVVLGMLAIGFSVLTLAGMKLFDIFWRLTR